jgi:hypothetical protein
MMRKGRIYICIIKRYATPTAVVLLILSAIMVASCSGNSFKAKRAFQVGTEPLRLAEQPRDESASTPETGSVPQGGGLVSDDAAGLEAPLDVSIKAGEELSSEEEDKDAEDRGSSSSEAAPAAPLNISPQFNREDYERLQPTNEMALEGIEGFFVIEGAEFIADESRIAKGDRFEVYDLLYRLPKDKDFWAVVETYAANIEQNHARKDWSKDTGYCKYFRIVERNWNKVISIYADDDKTYIEIRVMFRRLFNNQP